MCARFGDSSRSVSTSDAARMEEQNKKKQEREQALKKDAKVKRCDRSPVEHTLNKLLVGDRRVVLNHLPGHSLIRSFSTILHPNLNPTRPRLPPWTLPLLLNLGRFAIAAQFPTAPSSPLCKAFLRYGVFLPGPVDPVVGEVEDEESLAPHPDIVRSFSAAGLLLTICHPAKAPKRPRGEATIRQSIFC